GAALHTARAALTAGAGLVKLVAGAETIAAARASLPDVLTVESALGPSLEADAADALEWADAVVVGPGLGREPPRTPFLQAVLGRRPVPTVLDADALALFHGPPPERPLVLTPHLGEFRAQFGDQLADEAANDRWAGAARGLAGLGEPATARGGAPHPGGAGAAGDGVIRREGALRLGPGGEFDRLRAIFASLGAAGRGLGDDCALIPIGSRTLALSIDLSLEGVHFRTDWLSFREIGWRATAAALSDLAAEGATPLGVLVSVGLPGNGRGRGKGWRDPATEIMSGVGAAARSVG